MIEKIEMIKTKVLDFMDQEVGKYGNNRMDVKQVGDLADVIKDLAEAEYYCSVAKSMEGNQNEAMRYQGGGYMQADPMGSRGGYTSQGHGDPMTSIHEMLNNASPEMRAQIRKELLMSM